MRGDVVVVVWIVGWVLLSAVVLVVVVGVARSGEHEDAGRARARPEEELQN